MKKSTDNIKRLGRHIRELRLAKGITSQIALAAKAKVDRTYVGGIERGQKNPSLEILEKIAKALGTTLTDLMKFDGVPYSSDTKLWILNDKERKDK